MDERNSTQWMSTVEREYVTILPVWGHASVRKIHQSNLTEEKNNVNTSQNIYFSL